MKKFTPFLLFFLFIVAGFFFFCSIPKAQEFAFSSPIWRGGEINVYGKQLIKQDSLKINLNLEIQDRLIEKFAEPEDEISVLFVAERLFDAQGKARTINNEFYSTVLTPAGRPIEFSENLWGAPSKFNTKEDGLFFTTPLDKINSFKIRDFQDDRTGKIRTINLQIEENIESFEKGLYRPRVYFFYNKKGVNENKKATPEKSILLVRQALFPLKKEFISKPDLWDSVDDYKALKDQIFYLPMFKKGNLEELKMPAVLFAEENSQGSRGIVAEEDRDNFRISTHEINQSKLVLPPQKYSLNPALPLVASYDSELKVKTERVPLMKKGFLEGEIHLPNGSIEKISRKKITDFGVADEGPFQTGQAIAWKKIKTENKNTYDFEKTGKYKVFLNGKIYDEYNNAYEIGGTYDFFIGKKLTFSSAVKPGTPFFVGDAYFPRFAYFPSFKGAVKFKYTFYPFDKSKKPVEQVIEKENVEGGLGAPPIPFEEPGEYHVEVFAKADHFMMGEHFGTYVGGALVLPRDSKLELHGKIGANFADGTKITEPRFIAERNPIFETRREFYFPYYSGDILKIAANANNAIDPKVEAKEKGGEKITVIPRALNNFHPFNYPEKINRHAFLFIVSEKAGLIARSFVGSEFLEHGFWNVRNQSFGGRLNSSKYGDLENDIYRNFAAVYYEDEKGEWKSDHYVSNITITSEFAEDDRVIEPFSENFAVTRGVETPYLVGTAMQKPLGANFSQYLHVAPAVGDVKIQITLTDPNGKVIKFQPVYTDEHGFTPIGETYPLDILGVWHVRADAEYNGIKAEDLYKIFVISEETEKWNIGIPYMSKIKPEAPVVFKGSVPEAAEKVEIDYEVITPGAVLDSNEINICDFKMDENGFEYHFDFEKINSIYKNFEIQPLSRMAILYFHLSGEIEGERFYKFGTAMIRSDNMYYLGILPEH